MSDDDDTAWAPAPEMFPGEYALLLKSQRSALRALRAENARLKAALEAAKAEVVRVTENHAADFKALHRYREALREIHLMCTNGYYGKDGADYATASKRIAARARDGEKP